MANKKTKLDIKFIHEQLKKHEEILRSGIQRFRNNETIMFSVRILACNGAFPCSFSWCETEVDLSRCVNFKDIFDIEILELFIETGVLPSDVAETKKNGILLAFHSLSKFLDNCQETSKILQKYQQTSLKEVHWAGIFGTHILKQLTISKRMILSDCGYEKTGAEQCHCGCREELVYGDTSMGHKDVWHGSVDILVNNAAVNITEGSIDYGSAMEIKIDSREKYKHQLFPQAIVAGCSMGGLKPFIAVSKSDIKVLLYDIDSDILFLSEEFLFKRSLEIRTVLGLWLAVNHSWFGLDIDPAVKDSVCCSSFKAQMRDANKLDIYESKMHLFGCKRGHGPAGQPLYEILAEMDRRGIPAAVRSSSRK